MQPASLLRPPPLGGSRFSAADGLPSDRGRGALGSNAVTTAALLARPPRREGPPTNFVRVCLGRHGFLAFAGSLHTAAPSNSMHARRRGSGKSAFLRLHLTLDGGDHSILHGGAAAPGPHLVTRAGPHLGGGSSSLAQAVPNIFLPGSPSRSSRHRAPPIGRTLAGSCDKVSAALRLLGAAAATSSGMKQRTTRVAPARSSFPGPGRWTLQSMSTGSFAFAGLEWPVGPLVSSRSLGFARE
jgi:hypothetical protein